MDSLEELKNKRDKINSDLKVSAATNDVLYKELLLLNLEIKKQEKKKNTTENIDKYITKVKNMFNDYTKHKHIKEQLWIVVVDGVQYYSNKGKHTWTCEKRAKNAITEYIYYNAGIRDNENVDIGILVDKLIEEGYIVIKQLL